MRRRTIALLALATLVTLVFAGVPGPAVSATAVTKLSARKSGASVIVSGIATFSGEAANVAATDEPGDGPPNGTGVSPLGVDMVEAHVYAPDPKKPEIVFEWAIAPPGLPPGLGSLPEVNRYLWGIHVANGAKKADYVLQAKFTNIVTTNLPDDPPGHLSHIGNAFQLRGNCGVLDLVATMLSQCSHIAWLDGAFDQDAGVVRIVVPTGQAFMPEAVPGALITSFEFGGAVISTCHQVGVSNALLCDDAAWSKFNPYSIGRTVSVAVVKKGTPTSKIKFTVPAKVGPTGAFSGAVKTALKGAVDVWARACMGATCGRPRSRSERAGPT
jgi:hypothetical protein